MNVQSNTIKKREPPVDPAISEGVFATLTQDPENGKCFDCATPSP